MDSKIGMMIGYIYIKIKKKIRRRIYIQCQLTIKLHISSQLLSIKGTVGVFGCPIFYEFVFFLRTLFTKKIKGSSLEPHIYWLVWDQEPRPFLVAVGGSQTVYKRWM